MEIEILVFAVSTIALLVNLLHSLTSKRGKLGAFSVVGSAIVVIVSLGSLFGAW